MLQSLPVYVILTRGDFLCKKSKRKKQYRNIPCDALGAEFDMDTDDIDTKLGTLQDEIMRLASSKSDYDNLSAEIHRLRSIKQETQELNAKRQTKRQRISEMTEFLDVQSGIITEYDDKLTRQLVEKITVFEGKLQVSFKSGVDIEVEI